MRTQNVENTIRDFFRSKSTLSRLIIINTGIWVLFGLLKVVTYLMQLNGFNSEQWELDFLGLHSNVDVLFKTPWTIITYMFVHAGFLHLLFNMIMLYFGGILFSRYLGQKRFAYTYFLGGLSGALFFVVSYNLFPVFSGVNIPVVGASAAVLAIFCGVACYIPNYQIRLLFIGNIKLKYIIFVFVAIDILSISKENPGGHIAHLGGILYGMLSIWIPRYLKNYSKPKLKIKNKNGKRPVAASGRPLTDEEYNKKRAEKQDVIDAILDKISKLGYESLSKDEKRILFESGKN